MKILGIQILMQNKKEPNDSFRSLEELFRTITVLPKAKDWPSSILADKLEEHIVFLKSFGNETSGISDVSEERLQKLQKLLDSFFSDKRHKIQIIIESNINNLIKILYNSNKLFVEGKSLSDPENFSNLEILIHHIDKPLYPKIIKVLMMIYLSNSVHDLRLFNEIEHINEKLPPDSKEFISNINLYSDETEVLNNLRLIDSRNYLSNLIQIGIKEDYIHTLYFSEFFTKWIFSLKRFDTETIYQNSTLIKLLPVDHCKILFARTIVYIKNNKGIDKAKQEIENIREQIFFNLEGDPTEKSYWTVINSTLFSIDYADALIEACRIMNIFLSRDIIKKFFDFMGNQDDSTTVERSNFWRPYCASKQFENIHIVLTNQQKRNLYENLKPNEQFQFNRHLISNLSSGINESPALIISFRNKTIVEFTNIGNATQVINSDSAIIKSVIDYGKVYNTKSLKIYSQKSIFTTYSGEGTIKHSSGWARKTKIFLSNHGIQDGNE